MFSRRAKVLLPAVCFVMEEPTRGFRPRLDLVTGNTCEGKLSVFVWFLSFRFATLHRTSADVLPIFTF